MFKPFMVAMTIAALNIFAAPNAIAAEYNWRMYGILPPSHDYSKAMMESFKNIEARSDGRLKITFHYFAETPYQVGDALRILRNGLVEMAEWLPSYTAGTYPLLAAPELPFLSPALNDAAQAQVAANKAWSTPIVDGALQELLGEHRSIALARYYFEPMNFWFTSVVKSTEDMQDKKIRVFTPELGDVVSEIGATPTTVATTEQYTSLQRNVLNGTITGSGNLRGAKLVEVLKSGYIMNFMMTSARVLVSKPKYDSLPADLRGILDEEMTKLQDNLLAAMPKRDAQNQADAQAAGMVITKASDEQYAQVRRLAQAKAWELWKKRVGDVGAQALEQVTASSGTAQ